MAQAVDFLNSLIWNQWLTVFCLGAGLWFIIRTRFIQVHRSGEMGLYPTFSPSKLGIKNADWWDSAESKKHYERKVG